MSQLQRAGLSHALSCPEYARAESEVRARRV
jgi:hypothetical protein